MTQGIRQAISDLQSQLKYHQDAAARLSRAIGNLRDIPAVADGERPAKPAKAKRMVRGRKRKMGRPAKAPAAAAKPAAKTGRKKATLARVLMHVMDAYRKAKKGGVSAKQLMQDIQVAGFKFGGKNAENNMNYLYKTLRRNKAFKRTGDGLYGLA